MVIADKLTLLASSKEALRVKLGLPKSLPFSEYHKLAIRKPFEPTDLFAAGEQGIWYDPSDKSTLYQDAAGTQPVTTDGDPVGLKLDESQRLELGAEILPNTDFSDGWFFTKNKDNTVTNNTVSLSPADGYTAYANYLMPAYTLTAGKLYRVQCRVLTTDVPAGRVRISMVVLSPYELIPMMESTTQNGVMTGYFKISNSVSNITFRLMNALNSGTIQFSEPSFREIKGNHATQTVSAARPTYKTDGINSWLYHDEVDDKMFVDLPAMTATVVTATDDGVSIDYPVSIPSGNYTLTNNSTIGRDYGRLIIDKELSSSEQAQVTAYFNAKRGV